jgi:iron only hydrogenase large subunit-like protein
MFYPELIPHLSTARSPMGMLGPVIKTYYAQKRNIDPEKIVSVSVMPCTAKKFECARPEMNNAGVKHGKPEMRDTDIVITTRELARMIKQAGIDFPALEDASYDDVLSEYSGGGAIFGASGGVMEAAVRSAYFFVTKENPPPAVLELKPVRGLNGIKEAALDVPGFGEVRIAVVSGTANAKTVLEKVKDGTGKYHFIEFMACPGGCISGGGQPKTALPPSDVVRYPRTKSIYAIDEQPGRIRLSHENPQIKELYAEYLGKPCEGLAYELLHTHHYEDRSKHLTAKR